jgi:hypothetical protein
MPLRRTARTARASLCRCTALLSALLVCSIGGGSNVSGALAQAPTRPPTPSRAAAALRTTGTTRNRRKGSGQTCPNVRECGLASRAELDELAQDVALIDSYLTTVSGTVKVITTVSADQATCDNVDQSQAADFDVECVQDTELDPPDIELTSTCPPGFTAAIETVCWGDILDAQDRIIGRLTLLESGSFAGTAYCALGTAHARGEDGDALVAGSRVQVTQLIKCSFYEDEEGGARAATTGRRLGNASAVKIAGQIKAARKARRAAAAAASRLQPEGRRRRKR